MANYPNYIPDTNPCHLAGPPRWFQQKLWDFDPSLVLVASRQGFFYRLCQRRQLKLPEQLVNDILKEQADTRMLASYGLVPITTVLATVRWDNPVFFLELERRAPWRMGGAKKFTEAIEAQEEKERLAKAAKQNEHLDYLAKDAWRFYNKQIGTRTHLWSPQTKERALGMPAKAPGLAFPKARYTPDIQSSWLDTRHR